MSLRLFLHLGRVRDQGQERSMTTTDESSPKTSTATAMTQPPACDQYQGTVDGPGSLSVSVNQVACSRTTSVLVKSKALRRRAAERDDEGLSEMDGSQAKGFLPRKR